MNENRATLLRWLKVLFYIHLAGCLLSALNLAATAVPFSLGTWYTWAQRGVNLAVAVALLLLPGNYRYAGMIKASAMIFGILPMGLHALLRMDVQTYTYWSGILSRLSILMNMFALALEYIAHAAAAPGEKSRWYILLSCSLAVTILSYATMYILQPILQTIEMEEYLHFAKAWNVVVRSLGLVLSAANLVLLHRMIRYQEEAD